MSPREKAFFHEEGYFIHRAVFSQEEIEALKTEASSLAAEAGTACVRRLGEKSRAIRRLASSSKLARLLPAPWRPVRGILFNKTPDSNWPVAWHQDLTITVEEEKSLPSYGPWSKKDGRPHVQPPIQQMEQMATLRVHLDDAPEKNGALWVVPGSHRSGRLDELPALRRMEKDSICCSCNAGDVLMMAPLLLHSSRRSETPKQRRVIHIEYADKSLLHPHLEWGECFR